MPSRKITSVEAKHAVTYISDKNCFDLTVNQILEECRAMHNHIVIVHDHQIGRLIGYHEDRHDCYYHVRHLNGVLRDDRNECFYSCVGAAISLQGIERYKQLCDNHSLNGAPPEPTFKISRWDKEYQSYEDTGPNGDDF